MKILTSRIAHSSALASVLISSAAAAPRPVVDASAGGDHPIAAAASSIVGMIPPDDLQRFTFVLAEPSYVQAVTHDGLGGCPGDTTMTLVRDGEIVAFDDDGGEGLCSALDVQLQPGDYAVEIAGYGGVAVPDYRLDLTRTTQAEIGVPAVGGFDHGGHDRFAFDWFGGMVTLTVDDGAGGCPGDAMMEVYDVVGDRVAADDDSGIDRCPQVIADLAPGRYVMAITGWNGMPMAEYQTRVEPVAEVPSGSDVDCHLERFELVRPAALFDDEAALSLRLQGDVTGPDCTSVRLTVTGSFAEPVTTTIDLGSAVAFAADITVPMAALVDGESQAVAAEADALDPQGLAAATVQLDAQIPVYASADQPEIETFVDQAHEVDGGTDVLVRAALVSGAATEGTVVCVQPCGADARTTRLDIARAPGVRLDGEIPTEVALGMPACDHPTFVSCQLVVDDDAIPPSTSAAGYALTEVPDSDPTIVDGTLLDAIETTADTTPYGAFEDMLGELRGELEDTADVDHVLSGIAELEAVGVESLSVSTRGGSMTVLLRGVTGTEALGHGPLGGVGLPGGDGGFSTLDGEPGAPAGSGLVPGGDSPDALGGVSGVHGGFSGAGTGTLAEVIEQGVPGRPGASSGLPMGDPGAARRRMTGLKGIFGAMVGGGSGHLGREGGDGPEITAPKSTAWVSSSSSAGGPSATIRRAMFVRTGVMAIGTMFGGGLSAPITIVRFGWKLLKRGANAATGNSARNLDAEQHRKVQEKAKAYDPKRDGSNVDYCAKHFDSTTERSACMQNQTMQNKTYKKTCIDDGVQDKEFCKKKKANYCGQDANKDSAHCAKKDEGSGGKLTCQPGDPGCERDADEKKSKPRSAQRRMCNSPVGRPAGGGVQCGQMSKLELVQGKKSIVLKRCQASDCGPQRLTTSKVELVRPTGCVDARCTDPRPMP